MIALLIGLAVLIGGYFAYGLVVEKIFGIDASRPTPAKTQADGMDYVEMPAWKVFLIQFLNIAGLGPIFGAIMGVMFGPAAFLWIALGTIFAGAVHDFISGMISLRSGGVSLPEIVGKQLGGGVKMFMRGVSILLLILVGAVFILTPAGLLAGMTPDWANATFWTAIIFVYYLLATLLPIDKLIGRVYPIFGVALLFMAVALLAVLLTGRYPIPDGFADGLFNRHADAEANPLFPILFVTIACGAISGFHATQSPMMARCLSNERLARPIFYGAMVAEGIVALIWAAAAIAFTGGYDQFNEYMAANHTAGDLVHDISVGWLGVFGGALAILGVVAAPITTGDTALRSARLIVADMFGFGQRKLWQRLAVSLPIFAITFGFMMIDFKVLWQYFGWTNQLLATVTLWACAVYLARHGKVYAICLIPAMFMTVVVVSYICVAPEGLQLPVGTALVAGVAAMTVLTGLFARYRLTRRAIEPA